MTRYALHRGREWVIAPTGDRESLPAALTLSADPAKAWQTRSIDVAIERQQLLRICRGLATEIRTLPNETSHKPLAVRAR